MSGVNFSGLPATTSGFLEGKPFIDTNLIAQAKSKYASKQSKVSAQIKEMVDADLEAVRVKTPTEKLTLGHFGRGKDHNIPKLVKKIADRLTSKNSGLNNANKRTMLKLVDERLNSVDQKLSFYKSLYTKVGKNGNLKKLLGIHLVEQLKSTGVSMGDGFANTSLCQFVSFAGQLFPSYAVKVFYKSKNLDSLMYSNLTPKVAIEALKLYRDDPNFNIYNAQVIINTAGDLPNIKAGSDLHKLLEKAKERYSK